MDTALSYRKKFFMIKPFQSNKIMGLLKKRYTAIVKSIRNKYE